MSLPKSACTMGSYVQSKRIGCRSQRRTRQWGGVFVSTLPLWFYANSVVFRRSRCNFARIPLRFDAPAVVSREFRPLLGERLRLRAATAHAVGRGLRFNAPVMVSRDCRCISTFPLGFHTNSISSFVRIPTSSTFWPFPAGPLKFRRILVFLVPKSVGDIWRLLLASFGLF